MRRLFWLCLLLAVSVACARQTPAPAPEVLVIEGRAVSTVQPPQATPTLVPTYTPWLREQATATATATDVPTLVPANTAVPLVATETAVPATVVPTAVPTETAVPTATATATAAETLAIIDFTVEISDAPEGKQLTFSWETTGGTSAHLIDGSVATFDSDPMTWHVEPNGQWTLYNDTTQVPDPIYELQVFDDAEPSNMVAMTIQVPWACDDTPIAQIPGFCTGSGQSVWMAEQLFEGGRMLWMQDNPTIYVMFYDGTDTVGERQNYLDVWFSDEEPAFDPAIIPPDGLYQPERGFGKVWRTYSDVRERLGWALAPEVGYEGERRYRRSPLVPGASETFVRTSNGRYLILNQYADAQLRWQLITLPEA